MQSGNEFSLALPGTSWQKKFIAFRSTLTWRIAMLVKNAVPSRRTLLILSVAIATIHLSAGRATAQLRPELAWIPQNSVGFLHVRVGDLWNGEVGAPLRKQFPREAEQMRRELEMLLGASPELI